MGKPDPAYLEQLKRDGEKFAVTLESANSPLGDKFAELVRLIVKMITLVL